MIKKTDIRLFLLPMVLLVLQGCTAMSQTGGASNQPLQSDVATLDADGTLADGSIRHDTDNARVAQLWVAAEKARASEDQETASRYILQAIEVAPQDGVLLSRAAELQLQMNQPVLAESYAVKSNAYSQTNRTLLLRNWLIIEHAREIRGDLLGVRSAHKKVQEYQY